MLAGWCESCELSMRAHLGAPTAHNNRLSPILCSPLMPAAACLPSQCNPSWHCCCCHTQVVDDILDFTQTAEQLGKPQGQDLASGNLTAPVIYALQQSKELEEIIQSKLVHIFLGSRGGTTGERCALPGLRPGRSGFVC